MSSHSSSRPARGSRGQRADSHDLIRVQGARENNLKDVRVAMGSVSDIDLKQLVDDNKSLNEGAITVPGFTADGWYVRMFAAAGLDPDKPVRKFTKKERHDRSRPR